MRGNETIDSAAAFLSAFEAGWQRLLLFFGSCWFSVMVALFCDQIENTGRSLAHGEIGGILSAALELILWSPVAWLGLLLAGLSQGIVGIFILPILATALLILLYSDHAPWHGCFLLLIAHPIHSLWALEPKVGLPWLGLGVYLAGISWLYRQFILGASGLRDSPDASDPPAY